MKKIFEANSFLSNVLVPLIVLEIYCISFAYLSSHLFLEGVNFFFVSTLSKYVGILIVGLALTFLITLRTRKNSRLTFRHSDGKLTLGDIFLLLLPLTPVVQFVINNQEILSFTDSLLVLICFLLFSGLYIFGIPMLFGSVVSTRALTILGLAFVFTIESMALVSDYFAWFERGHFLTQLMIFGGVFLVVFLLFNLNQRKTLYLIVVANFVLNSSIQLWEQNKTNAQPGSFEQNELLSLVGDRDPVITPNIYLLIYDAYVPNETMLAYGLDNSAQESYLSDQGFKLYPHVYSIGAGSVDTMSKVLNASTEYYGNMRRGVSGDGIVQNILKHSDYKTYGLFFSDDMFRGYGESYDYSIPESSSPPFGVLIKAVFLGEFRFDIQDVGYREIPRDEFVQAKQDVLKDLPGNRVFVYMHTSRPQHTQNSGACLPDEVEMFELRLREANNEMRQDLELLLANDPGAIVVVAGDHGPYLTKNCNPTTDIYDISEISRLDIQDRYATFLAIRWPTGDFESYDDIMVLQDLFPAVFAYLYKDTTILESKIEPIISIPNVISGVSVENGTILGGLDDGEPLFLSGE